MRLFSRLVLTLALLILAAQACVAQSPVRIACGQALPYTDSLGNVWAADTDFNAGGTFIATGKVTGTPDPALYQNQRYDLTDSPAMTYTIPAPAGSYTLNLHFAETYVTGAGQRLFNVAVNGTPVLTAFDVYAAAGAAFVAVTKSFPVTSTGTVTVTFTHGSIQNPFINAIELLPAVPPALQVAIAGLGTVNFWIANVAQVPVCGPADGTCSIAIQVCDTATPQHCLSSNAGSLSLVKKVSLPTPQTQQTVIVTATNP